jgi:three-Cys-motif partner protein
LIQIKAVTRLPPKVAHGKTAFQNRNCRDRHYRSQRGCARRRPVGPLMNAGCAGRSAQKSSAVDARIRALGGTPICYSDPADVAVDKIVAAVNPSGLHFAFLDPYNLEGLSFDIIRKLSKLKVDMLIHVSVQDLQRNLDDYSKQGGVFDTFAPGWKAHVNPNQAINSFRAALMKYWMGEIRKLGTMPAKGVELIVGSKGQRLYWLVFVSGHDHGRKLWEAIRDPMRQTTMGF